MYARGVKCILGAAILDHASKLQAPPSFDRDDIQTASRSELESANRSRARRRCSAAKRLVKLELESKISLVLGQIASILNCLHKLEERVDRRSEVSRFKRTPLHDELSSQALFEMFEACVPSHMSSLAESTNGDAPTAKDAQHTTTDEFLNLLGQWTLQGGQEDTAAQSAQEHR